MRRLVGDRLLLRLRARPRVREGIEARSYACVVRRILVLGQAHAAYYAHQWTGVHG